MGGYVEQVWRPDPSALGGRRARQPFTYQAYVPGALNDLALTFTAATAGDIADAERALAIANHRQPMVALETLARLLLRSESIASSRIEGLVCGQRRLAEAAFDPAHATQTARTVLANIDAMRQAVDIGTNSGELSVDDVCRMHTILLRHDRQAETFAGKLRDVQNWIGGRHDSPRDAAYVPPPPEQVEPLMADLIRFINRDDLPGVAQAAIAHAQFETIHPFVDGNGRIGRCLVHAVLTRRGLSPRTLAPISLVLAAHGDDYIKGLIDFREGRIDEWCATFAAATGVAMHRAVQFEQALAGFIARWRVESQARAGSLLERACEQAIITPVFNTETLRTELGCSNNAALTVIGRLLEIGVITEATLGKRNRVWINRAVLRLLDDFERDLLTDADGKEGRLAVSRPAASVIPPPALPPIHHAVLDSWASLDLPLSTLDVAEQTGHEQREVRSALEGLSGMGLVERTNDRPARWQLTPYGAQVRESLLD
jgi:Fic family protein